MLFFFVFFLCLSFASSPLTFTHTRHRMPCLCPPTPIPRGSLARSSMPPSHGRPDAPRLLSTGHSYGDTVAFPSIFPVLVTVYWLLIPQATAFYPTTKQQRLLLSTVTFVTAGTATSHTQAQSDSHLAMKSPSDVQNFGDALLLNKRRRSDIGNHVWVMLQAAAWESHISHLDLEAASAIVCLGPAPSARLPSHGVWTPTYSAGLASSKQCVLSGYMRSTTSLSTVRLVGSGHGWSNGRTCEGGMYGAPPVADSK